MKRVFTEPKMKRIELNLKENIASSSTINVSGYWVNNFDDIMFCPVQGTGELFGNLWMSGEMDMISSCRANSQSKARLGATFIPEEEAMRCIGR